MIFLILSILLLPLALLSRRLAGGLIGKIFPSWPGTQAARLLWGLILTLWAASLTLALGGTLPWWLILGLGMSWPVGAAILGNEGMALRNRQDYFKLFIHGLVMSAGAAISAGVFAHSLLVPLILVGIGGLTLGCYVAAWAAPLNILWLGCLNNSQDVDPPPTAELYQGILQTLGIGLAVVLMV